MKTVRPFFSILKNLLLFPLPFLLAACLSITPLPQPTPSRTATHFPTSPTLIPTPTPQPTNAPFSGFTMRLLTGQRAQVTPSFTAQLPTGALTAYFYNRLTDYLYAPNGDLWLIGGFGVLRQRPNGEQTWYSMMNGLPANYFQAIAVSPEGEVWVGGIENTLLRFDGRLWHDETASLLALPQESPWWTCRSRTIFGIDFDENGQIWVANSGIHLYTRENGQWKDVGFPLELPMAGGGGCPVGLRVLNANRITIARHGCCSMPMVAYHFDGREWTQDQNLKAFEEHLVARRAGPALNLQMYDLRKSDFPFPFSPEQVLPADLHPIGSFGNLPRPHRFGDISLTFDERGALWMKDHYTLFENQSGRLERHNEVLLGGELFEPDFQAARWLNFSANPVILNPDGHAVEFSRWFWWQTELGNRYGPLISDQATEWNPPWLYFSRDLQGRVWFYLPGEGLVMSKNDQMTTYPGPADLTLPALGGLHVLNDGRVLVGTTGAVWVFAQGAWQKWVFPDTLEVFWRFAEGSRGVIFAATDSEVYQIVDGEYTRWKFPAPPNSLPPRALLLATLTDERVIYVNSSILAQWDGSNWRSYLFERISLASAAVDSTGNLWAYAGHNGLLRFASTLFQP